jgi:hypothetical protein
MRRSLYAVAAFAVVIAGCQDQQQPLAPAPLQIQASSSSSDEHPDVWILGRTYTLASGTVCTFVEQEGQFGSSCGGTFLAWDDFDFNNDLYPIVEICRLDLAGQCAADRTFFVRKAGEITSSDDRKDSNDKYVLRIDNLPEGRYRAIVAITFTGVASDNTTRTAAWDHTSDKVLGHYEFSRSSSNSGHNVQFRIRTGALCEGDGQRCAETSFDPQGDRLVFDTNYDLTDGEGIVGLLFPDLGSVLQERVNIILERIPVPDGGRCITSDKFVGSEFSPGRELAPCYNVRTEPYIDLYKFQELLGRPIPPIQFAVCLEKEADNIRNLLKMLKWSSVKGGVTDMGIDWPDQDLFDCPDTYSPKLAAVVPEGTTRFAGATRLFAPLGRFLGPQPAYASVFFSRSPANGSLMDFSRIVVQADDHYEAVYLSPIGVASSTRENLGPITPTVGVHLCLEQGSGCAPQSGPGAPPNHWRGTAVWDASARLYQVNWNTPRNQAEGTYRLELTVNDLVIVAPDEINISFGTAGYTHNPGRTLPIKFFLTTAQ